MTALTAAELSQIRSDISDHLLPDSANLLTVTRTSDGQGGFTEVWGTATASVACRLDYVRGVKVVIGGALQPFSGWMLTLPYDTTITTAYRVEHGGNEFSVIGEDSDKSWKASVRVPVELV